MNRPVQINSLGAGLEGGAARGSLDVEIDGQGPGQRVLGGLAAKPWVLGRENGKSHHSLKPPPQSKTWGWNTLRVGWMNGGLVQSSPVLAQSGCLACTVSSTGSEEAEGPLRSVLTYISLNQVINGLFSQDICI